MQLVFWYLFAVEVVVAVPLVIERVLGEADVVAEAQRPVMVHNAVQVVAGFNLQSINYEAFICCVG